MRLAIALIVIGMVCSVAGQDAGTSTVPFAQQVADLGSDDFRVREQAHQQLREAGAKVKTALEEAAENSTDAEVRERAGILLRRLGAGPRIAEALAKLNADTWDDVKAAVFALCDELGEDTGAEDAVRKACDGQTQAAKIARVLRQQWENWERQQQSFVRNVTLQHAQFLQQYYANFRQNMKRSVESMCKREFDQMRAKKEQKEQPEKK